MKETESLPPIPPTKPVSWPGYRLYAACCQQLNLTPIDALMRSKRLQTPADSITSFDFSHRELSVDDCRGIVSFLGSLNNLTHLALNQIPFNPKSFKLIIDFIARSHIDNLEFFGLHPPTEHIPMILRVLECPTLERLKLGDNSFSSETLVNIAQAVVDSPAQIVQLHLGGNLLGSGDREAVEDFMNTVSGYRPLISIGLRSCGLTGEHVPALVALLRHPACEITDLQLKNNPLGEAGGSIADSFYHNDTLRVLELQSTLLNATAVSRIAQALPNLPSLRAINLNNNPIGDAGAQALADSLAVHCSISTLGLSGIRCTALGARYIGSALRDNPVVTGLDLSHNALGDQGAADIAAVIHSSSVVESVDLSNNGIGVRGGVILAKAVASSGTVRHIDLGRNHLTDTAAAEWGAALAANTVLQRLCLTDNQLTDRGAEALYVGLRQNRVLTNFSYGGQSTGANVISRSWRHAIDRIVRANRGRGGSSPMMPVAPSSLGHVRYHSSPGLLGVELPHHTRSSSDGVLDVGGFIY
ncbi:Leucine Rich repeat [Carpediemonas membranifera]|uniref:Leucine Rich repeat n=1 Tax=Carpediemonas membranifera TaxID=201153 RepID=A0A8J6AXJ1_9EUKA|nr:Leucine Rich repeat [Carpediemonas membranifera]|eukprot:KAG9396598.1 Leucine Rich repeat [Carpediemonas membranifera]